MTVSPQTLIRAYCQGAFPMARDRHGALDWYSPDPRAILPLEPSEAFHVSASLRRRVRSGRFRITRDAAFGQVIEACARPRPQNPETWINDELRHNYGLLHEMGLAHSVEAWLAKPDAPAGHERLVGGLYGVAIGAAFFGESMFSHATDASKVCLVHLVEHLRRQGYQLLDVQFTNPHLARFGVIEIPRSEYLQRLHHAILQPTRWSTTPQST